MSFTDYVRAVAERWRLATAILGSALLLALGITYLTPAKYAASTTLYISAQSGGANATTAYQGGLLSEQRVASYSQLLASKRVGDDAARDLSLPIGGSEIASKVTVVAQPNTVLLTASVEDRSPERAALLANGIANSFVRLVTELEQPPDRSQPPSVVARVVQAATPDANPVSPSLALNLALGLLVGVVGGTGAAIALKTLDTSIRGREDLADLAERADLGQIYQDETIKESGSSLTHISSASQEEYRQIRTNLQFVAVDKQVKLVVLASPNAAEGKTTTTANIAAVCADAGYRVLVVDADLRRPRLARDLGLETQVGLTTILSGRTSLEVCIQRSVAGNFDVLASGQIPPNPSELLASNAMAALASKLRSAYDFVFFDAAPVLPVTDAAVLSSHCDGTILIARFGETKRSDVERAMRNLAQTSSNVIGTVLTMVPRKNRPSYYYQYQSVADSTKSASGHAPVGVNSGGRGTEKGNRTQVSSNGAQEDSASTRPTPRPRQ